MIPTFCSIPFVKGALALTLCAIPPTTAQSDPLAPELSYAQAKVGLASHELAEDGLAHEEVALRWLAAHGVDGETIIGEPERLLTEALVGVDLGLFNVYFPPRTEGADRVPRALTALLDVQEVWATWCLNGSGKRKLPKAVNIARKTIDKWLKGLSRRELTALPAGAQLFAGAQANEKVLEARTIWANWVRSTAGAQGVWPGDSQAVLVLLPTRTDFVEFACVLGHSIPDMRGVYWAPTVQTWSELDFFGHRVSPLAYASPKAKDGYAAEYPMDLKNKRGLEEHIAQIATRSLLDIAFTAELDAFVAGGLANLLLIDIFGEADTMVDGDRRANSAKGGSRFIPAREGGQSFGGMLPAVSAESRWRADKGADHFLKVLRNSQKAGKKKAKTKVDRTRSFILEGESKRDTFILKAPLLHPSAATTAIASQYFGDFAEMARAYRVAFLYWLREESSKESNEHFMALLKELGQGRELILQADFDDPSAEKLPAPFPTAVEKAFAMPLSQELISKEDLEGRFLLWLAR